MQVTPTPNNNNLAGWDRVKNCSPKIRPMLARLSDDEKVQVAVQRIINGQWVYFTCGHVHSQSPFRLELRERVVTELKKSGFEVIEQEDIDDGTSIYGPETKGYLDGVYVYLKAIALGLQES
jgi:hypothetical protein